MIYLSKNNCNNSTWTYTYIIVIINILYQLIYEIKKEIINWKFRKKRFGYFNHVNDDLIIKNINESAFYAVEIEKDSKQ